MSPENIQEIRDGAGDRLPLFLCNIEYDIISFRGKTKKRAPQKAKYIVCKGSEQQITKSLNVKRRCIATYFLGLTTAKEKTFKYDLSKIEIRKIHYIKHIGYGIK